MLRIFIFMNKIFQKPTINKGLIPSTDRIKSDQLLFIICIVIASLFWFLIKLSDPYSTTYTFKISYNNEPTDKMLTALEDSTINLSLRARGFKILQLNLFENTEEANINLSNYKLNQRSETEYFIYTQPLEERIANLLEIPETEIQFSKTTLSFILEDLESKQVIVEENLSFLFTDQYDLYEEASISPEKVTIYGPLKVLDTVNSISTEQKTLSDIEENQVVAAKLINPNPDLLRMTPEEVNVNLKVEKFTETVFEIPVDLSKLGVSVRTFPSKVKLYCKVAQKDFNTVQEAMFNVTPVVSDEDISKSDKLRLQLTAKPEFVRNVRMVPTEVEFLILK